MATPQEPVVPIRVAKNSKSMTAFEGKCPECSKWITLVKPGKTRPKGSRFHDHKGIRPSRTGFGNADCYGSPYYIRTDDRY